MAVLQPTSLSTMLDRVTEFADRHPDRDASLLIQSVPVGGKTKIMLTLTVMADEDSPKEG